VYLKKLKNLIDRVALLGVGAATLSGAKLAKIRKVTVRVRGVGNMVMRPHDSDLDVFLQVFVNREYDLSRFPQHNRMVAEYQQILARGEAPVIIDAGANVGAAALWFSLQFPEAVVLAVEPDPANVELCRANTRGRSNIIVHPCAVGAQPGAVALERHAGHSWATQTVRSDDGVRVVPIAELCETVPSGTLFLVKVDIEGFERDLFSANCEWLDSCAAIFVEPHDWMFPGQGTSRPMQDALLGRKFEVLTTGETLVFVR
jgi:FkbM family methyltransferase